jgi:hypothetical protein
MIRDNSTILVGKNIQAELKGKLLTFIGYQDNIYYVVESHQNVRTSHFVPQPQRNDAGTIIQLTIEIRYSGALLLACKCVKDWPLFYT